MKPILRPWKYSPKIKAELAKALDVNVNYLLTQENEFILGAGEQYGYRGRKGAQVLVGELTGLFSGGDLAEEDMDELMLAIQKAYVIAKENNRKYAPQKIWELEEPKGLLCFLSFVCDLFPIWIDVLQ